MKKAELNFDLEAEDSNTHNFLKEVEHGVFLDQDIEFWVNYLQILSELKSKEDINKLDYLGGIENQSKLLQMNESFKFYKNVDSLYEFVEGVTKMANDLHNGSMKIVFNINNFVNGMNKALNSIFAKQEKETEGLSKNI